MKSTPTVLRPLLKGQLKHLRKLLANRRDEYAELHDSLCRYDPEQALGKVYDTESSSFVTMVHGDCWMNNMFFRREEGGELRMKVIDYGAMHR